ncbi:hypothetical protein LJR009_000024 [Bosea sp. LjRoot9]|uniref:hypothetical protein n=1 Tax=Bosea sp. LjRoot9 TaxID=3342341 RepID=UPI003ECC992E
MRTKAGANDDGDKRINRVAVLAELKVAHEDQLYPTEDAFPPIGTLIARPIVGEAAAMACEPGLPLIIHGAGGMGKTVLMQSLAATLGLRDQVVIFDGFGAGRWRDPADGRHRSEKTLVHLANLLAGHGLCDILLPISEPSSLLRAFRQRLTQAVTTARQASDEAGVVLRRGAMRAARSIGIIWLARAKPARRSIPARPPSGLMISVSLMWSCWPGTTRASLSSSRAEAMA